MGVFKSFFKATWKILGQIFDFRFNRWIGWNTIKDNTHYFVEQAKVLYALPKPKRTESFEEALKRLELSEAELQEQIKRFNALTFMYLTIALLLLGYALIILLFNSNVMGGVISIALAFFALTNAFRYHFFAFQMKHKKLGCTLREWWKSRS